MPENLNSCPFCHSNSVHRIWDGPRWDYCQECGLYFRNPMPTQQELDTLYESSWTDPEQCTSETGGTSLALARVYANRLLRALGLSSFQGLRILDFGAGRGNMLKALQELGAEVVGVETYGKVYLESQGFEGYEQLSEVVGRFDGIVTIDVVEHLHSPWDTLKTLNVLLKEKGWLYVATGNPLGLNARVNGSNWREAKKAGHLVFPSPRTLEKMLLEAGFLKVERLKWLIRFHRNPVRIILNYGMQMLGVDGELRYLGWK